MFFDRILVADQSPIDEHGHSNGLHIFAARGDHLQCVSVVAVCLSLHDLPFCPLCTPPAGIPALISWQNSLQRPYGHLVTWKILPRCHRIQRDQNELWVISLLSGVSWKLTTMVLGQRVRLLLLFFFDRTTTFPRTIILTLLG